MQIKQLISNDKLDASRILAKNGVVIVPREYLVSDKLLKDCLREVDNINTNFSHKNDFLKLFSNNIECSLYSGLDHAALARSGRRVIVERHGAALRNGIWRNCDAGLYDMLNHDIGALQSTQLVHLEKKCRDISTDIIRNSSKHSSNVIFKYSSIYMYYNVTEPRRAHIDGFKRQFKSFLSLSDCRNVHCGPLSYKIGSQKRIQRYWAILSRLINDYYFKNNGFMRNDIVINQLAKVLPLLVRPLDLVISDQRGIHGDLACTNRCSNELQKIIVVGNYL